MTLKDGQFGSCLHIPNLQGFILRSRNDATAIGGKCACFHPPRVARESDELGACLSIPNFQGLIEIRRSRNDAAPIRGEGAGIDTFGVAFEHCLLLSAAGVPQPQRSIRARRGQGTPVGGEDAEPDMIFVAFEQRLQLSAAGVPQPQRVIVRARERLRRYLAGERKPPLRRVK